MPVVDGIIYIYKGLIYIRGDGPDGDALWLWFYVDQNEGRMIVCQCVARDYGPIEKSHNFVIHAKVFFFLSVFVLMRCVIIQVCSQIFDACHISWFYLDFKLMAVMWCFFNIYFCWLNCVCAVHCILFVFSERFMYMCVRSWLMV